MHRPEYASEYPGLELVLKEGVLSSGDANCCPSRILVSIYAYRADQDRYRLYDRYYEAPDGIDPS